MKNDEIWKRDNQIVNSVFFPKLQSVSIEHRHYYVPLKGGKEI
jgi:hypothetical protein